MSYLDTLNTEQKEAVTTLSRYCRIVAGAGSGKTRVLISRIAYLIDTLGYESQKICAITFTNKAANEMKQRLMTLLHDAASGVHISTIHSLCVTILRKDITALSYPRNFTILDSDDQKAILKEAYKQVDLSTKEYTFGAMLTYISAMKGENIPPQKAKQLAYHNPLEQKKADIYAYYCERQKKLYALDFDDLLLWTVELFKTHSDKLAYWQNRYGTILVDEFQDVDRVQYELIRLLAGDHNEVYVVGDPDQTIYTWRGADVNIIMNFETDFHDAQTIYLNQNYRSTKNILDGANSLIAYNKNRLKKNLFTQSDEGEKLYLYNAGSDEIEADFVCEKIKELKKQNISYKDIAILYRSNYISRNFEKTLAKSRIPYKIYGGLRFYDRMEVKDSLSYLRLLLKEDDLSFKRVVNSPKRGVGDASLEKIDQASRTYNMTYMEVIRNHSEILKGKAKSELLKFIQQIDSWKSRMNQMAIVDVLEMIINESGYKTMLLDMNEPERIENVKELQNDILFFEKNNPNCSLDEYLQTISLVTDKDVYEEGEYVSLMTVHAAKGLEYDYVFIVSFSDGVFPSARAMSENASNGIEEERRLAYVALTRAKKALYLTNAQGFSYITDGPKTPSRFINEIDERTIERLGIQDENKTYYDAKNIVIEEICSSKNDFKKGDLINHTIFGDGIVLRVDGDTIQVAFGMPTGIKTLMAGHPSITKREK